MRDLVAVRGIGPWTVHMFLIFSGRRPDVCPVGDLGTDQFSCTNSVSPSPLTILVCKSGIQRALCAWYVDDPHNSTLGIHSRKLKPAPKPKRDSTPPPASTALPAGLPPSTPLDKQVMASDPYPTPSSPGLSINTVTSLKSEIVEEELVVPPKTNPFVWPETSNDLTVATLKSRLNGKKLK